MLEKLSAISHKIAAMVGDRIQFGVKTQSRKVESVVEDSAHYVTLASLLPYDVYDPETGLFYNKRSAGFVLEASPLLGANEETVNILASVLTDVIPKNVDLQFILWGSDKIGETLDAFEKERSGRGEIFEWLAKKRSEFLKEGAYKSLTHQGQFILRDFRFFISLSSAASAGQGADEWVRLREDVMSSLKSIQIHSQSVSADEFISVVTDLLHPSCNVYPTRQRWNPYDSLSLQVTDPEYFIRVERDKIQFENADDVWEARALSVKEFPQSMAQWRMMDSIGQLFNTSLQIPCPFVISLSVRLIDQEKANMSVQFASLKKEKSAKSQLAKFMPLISQEYEDWKYVKNRMAEGDRLVQTFFQIILFSSKKQAGQSERKVRDLYRANGWRLKKTAYLQLQSLLAMLPMMMSEGMLSDLKRLGRLQTMTAFNAVNVAPLQGEWKGTGTPSLILPGRRGQITTFNPFDNTEGNYNIAISAASGKGKSVLIQEYIVSILGSGGRVWVIDVGRSYEKTCKLLNGTFIEFTRDNSICLNPFTFIRDFNASLTMLKPLLAAMVHPTTNASDEEIAFLEKAAKAAWEEKGNSATITTVANWLVKQDSPLCQNLSHLLYSYTQDGMNAGYFEGACNIDLNNSFVVLELQELKARKDLQQIVLLLLMYQISEAMYLSKRDQPKSCIIDEAPDLLSGDNQGAEKFIGTGYRQARKYYSNFVTSMQGINDYFKNDTTIAMYENSDIKIILGQNSETIDQIKKSERLSMDAFTERLYKSLRKTDDYSECVIKTPSGISVHRIILDYFSRIMVSSKAEEFNAVAELQKQGKSLQEAIEIIARKFNHAY